MTNARADLWDICSLRTAFLGNRHSHSIDMQKKSLDINNERDVKAKQLYTIYTIIY